MTNRPDIDAIQARISSAHEAVLDNEWFYWQRNNDAEQVITDAATLLAMVDELRAKRDDPLMRVLPDGSVEMLRCKHCAELQADNDRLRIANRNCGDEILRLRAALEAAPKPRKHGIETHVEMHDWYDGPRAEALNK